MLGRFEASLHRLRLLKSLEPHDARVDFNLGWFKMREGKFQEAMALLVRGRQVRNWGSWWLDPGLPRWSGGDPRGKKILFVCEAGLGDEIIAVRFARLLAERGVSVDVSCHPSLATLFSRVVGVRRIVGRDEMKNREWDFWIPGQDAPFLLLLSETDLFRGPYLRPHPIFVEKWRDRLRKKKRFRVGLRWQGNPDFEHELKRTLPAEELFRLGRLPIELISLQRDVGAEKARGVSHVMDLSNDLKSWEDTAAAVSQLDLVISSCTSTAHLAAALGTPVWILVPQCCYYMWALPGERTPCTEACGCSGKSDLVFGRSLWRGLRRSLRGCYFKIRGTGGCGELEFLESTTQLEIDFRRVHFLVLRSGAGENAAGADSFARRRHRLFSGSRDEHGPRTCDRFRGTHGRLGRLSRRGHTASESADTGGTSQHSTLGHAFAISWKQLRGLLLQSWESSGSREGTGRSPLFFLQKKNFRPLCTPVRPVRSMIPLFDISNFSENQLPKTRKAPKSMKAPASLREPVMSPKESEVGK